MFLPRVTVVICAYNRTDLLRESIQSVLNQTYKDIRIVVLDDCSTEDVEGVVRSFDDERIEYIRNEKNLGLTGNWNRAIEICDTEYLNIFHDDDRMFPWMIGKMVGVLDDHQRAALVLSGKFFTLGSLPVPGAPDKMHGVLREKNELIKDICAKGHNYTVCPSAVFRKKTIDESGVRFRDDVGLAADLYFWMEANNKGLPIFVVKSPVLEYRQHAASFSNVSGWEKWIFTHKKIDDFIESLNIDCDVSRLRETFAKYAIMGYALSDERNFDALRVKGYRIRLKDEMKWEISDRILNEEIAIHSLGESIQAVSAGKIRFRDYLKKQREFCRKGFYVPFGRQVKWFLKYVVVSKMLRMIHNER
jgi:glycosyltransferase involved in cell wall biosynthesis